MKNLFCLFAFIISISINAQKDESRFVYELKFEVNPNASVTDAEKQFFHFYNGFKRSKVCTEVIALQHHTGDRMEYKILAFSNNWDDLDDMIVDAQTYFAEMDPTMFTAPWKISHTADAVFAVRRSFEEGFISQ